MLQKPYVYVFIRRDLPLADQIVQTAHATQESGAKFGCPENCHMVLCGVKNQNALLNVADLASFNNIQYSMFYEPDSADDETPMGNTALCTQPIYGEQCKIFKKYQIWKP